MIIRSTLTLFFATALSALPAIAVAQDEPVTEPGVAGWFELNSFHSASTPEDSFSLERGQQLDHLQFAFQAVFQVDNDPLTWQREEDGEMTVSEIEVERQLAFHVSAAMGLWKFAQLGAQLPVYIDKGLEGGTPGGIGDTRVLPKLGWRWELEKISVGASTLLAVAFPSGKKSSYTGEGQVTFEPRIALDLDFGRFRLIGNGGALVKDGESRYGLGRGKELFGGLGGDLSIPREGGVLHILAEFNVATQAHDFFSHQATPVEALAGFRYRFDNGISLMGAVGTSLTGAAASPNVRMLLGLGVVPAPVGTRERREAEREAAEKKWAPVDTDGDGLKDFEDFCKEEAEDYDNFEDDDGCPDEDNDKDGVPDVEDMCPNQKESPDAEDRDGCPAVDTDRDGIPDSADQCRQRPEDKDGFRDEDGCPDLDDDGDAVPDSKDQCPKLPESAQRGAVYDGCPDSFKLEGNRLVLTARFEFAPRKARLTAWSKWVLTDVATAMKTRPEWTELRIKVHTSGKGNAGRNQKLSEERAMLIIKTLVDFGVAPDRLVATGVGDSEPVDSPKTAEGRENNERVELTIAGAGGEK